MMEDDTTARGRVTSGGCVDETINLATGSGCLPWTVLLIDFQRHQTRLFFKQ
jgi:hypothetical protein